MQTRSVIRSCIASRQSRLLVALLAVVSALQLAAPSVGFAQNTPLEAVDDTATTTQDTPVTIDVLANDTGDGITIVHYTNGPHGTTALQADGTITYTPESGYVGNNVFTYQIEDANGSTDAANVTVTVTAAGPGTGPDAVDDTATTPQDTPVAIEVLANDSGGQIFVSGTPVAAHGTVENVAFDTLRYTPELGFTGTDTFEYQIADADNQVATATVTVTVTVAEEPPPTEAPTLTPTPDVVPPTPVPHVPTPPSNPPASDQPVTDLPNTGSGSSLDRTVPVGAAPFMLAMVGVGMWLVVRRRRAARRA